MHPTRKAVPPALKHGVYSGMTLLPGENAEHFKKLHNDLVDEFAPVGPLENEIVESIARLTWRKRNLSTYQVASEANARYSVIRSRFIPDLSYERFRGRPDEAEAAADAEFKAAEVVEAAEETADKHARKELGPTWELVEIGEVAKLDHLEQELALVDRLDGMIDRCLKRLLFVRGLKSIQTSSSAEPPRKRLSAGQL